MKKDVKVWAEEIKKNKAFAEKYKGLDAKLLIEQAQKDGYEIDEDDLNDEKLKNISGGVLDVTTVVKQIGNNTSVSGNSSTATVTMNVNM